MKSLNEKSRKNESKSSGLPTRKSTHIRTKTSRVKEMNKTVD